ncbi:hypothetical protein [Streptomyces sp. NPDC059894]|uniref:hypothetical protein n=1 Tax=unclassified Streptomyces TaxID=2593676 RepID=UPI00364A8613
MTTRVLPAPPADDDGPEARRLLGPAWDSSWPRLVSTSGFDVVRAPEQYAAPAVEHLRRLRAPHGSVAAEGADLQFFVPPDSGSLPWPDIVTYITRSAVWVPHRSAHRLGLTLRWAVRDDETGRLLTAPLVLWATLTALAPPARPRPPAAAPGYRGPKRTPVRTTR